MTDILGPAVVDPYRATAWAVGRGGTPQFVRLVPLYWTIGASLGVRGDIAYAQAGHETGLGHFGGTDPVFSVDVSAHNWCGIKTRDGALTARFTDDATGVLAHIQHLGLYAGAPWAPIPAIGRPPADPRSFVPRLGAAPTVAQLSGKWADPGVGYGEAVQALLDEMAAT